MRDCVLQARKKREEAKLIVTEGEYKGFPTLTFDGPVRRFSLGLTNLRALKDAWPKVEEILERHRKAADDDDIKI